jgi:hypothetical protein
MDDTTPFDLIVPENFIQATRDSGYKSLGSALAELVDNSFEANASRVSITILKSKDSATDDMNVVVADNGRGMDAKTLRHSLQFGWSSRFNQRNTFGRYGMGLPNASLSHARRVDVWSSIDGKTATGSYLDVDEVLGRHAWIPRARAVPMINFLRLSKDRRGTAVIWSKCDRLNNRKLGPLSKKLRRELGRLFRYQLWAGKEIIFNDQLVTPFDPLFVENGTNLVGAKRFGPNLTYQIALPEANTPRTSTIEVVFSELPVANWHSLSNVEKNDHGIAKNAGVSVVRAGREIDRGWFFMGQKRKENYDDWWRCEVRFNPELDELFGVTHTKQEIHPTEQLFSILAPDLERIARELNNRARRAFLEVKSDVSSRESEKVAERHDRFLEPPRGISPKNPQRVRELQRDSRGRICGLEYRLTSQKLDDECFYTAKMDGARVTVVLNAAHPVVSALFDSDQFAGQSVEKIRRNIELLVLAAARTELTLTKNNKAKTWIKKFRQSWSRTLATFLS